MPLTPGTRLGPYEIVAPLGAGGMGEVYRARDTRLGRDVAVKVLPQHLSANAEVRTRFEREAKTVSSLNHPNICTLFDVGREGDTDYLVMELIEGETLSQRVSKGALPMPDVLRIGAQIADALDRAHRAGVIHRDLKPGNIMLTKSGAKLMDFGLARAGATTGPVSGSGATMAALTQSPTMVSPLTAEGAIVGTFQYMSPEQLEGREADSRSDLWALGCVLYEMATGRRAFDGRSQASLITAIMGSQPVPLAQIAPMSPPALERVVNTLLAKDAEDRIQTAHDVKLQLAWIAEPASQSSGSTISGMPATVVKRRAMAPIVAATVGIVGLAAAALMLWRVASQPRPTIVSQITAPRDLIIAGYWSSVAISPDGNRVAAIGQSRGGPPRLWIWSLDSPDPTPIAVSGGGNLLCWSPDSRSIAYTSAADKGINRIPVAGGSPTRLCDISDSRGMSWGTRNVLVFSPSTSGPLMRVPADGGTPEPASELDRARGESGHRFPRFLPDGEHFLFSAVPRGPSGFTIRLGRLGSLESKIVMQSQSGVAYVAPGYLLFVQNGKVTAQRFDLRALKCVGERFTLGDAPIPGDMDAEPVATASNDERLLYPDTKAPDARLEWLDRGGAPRGVVALPDGDWNLASLSPDEKSALATYGGDLWQVDLERGVPTRLLRGVDPFQLAQWSPDGRRIVATAREDGVEVLRLINAGGGGVKDSLPRVPAIFKEAQGWAADGSSILVAGIGSIGDHANEASSWDWYRVPLNGGATEPYLLTPAFERRASLSPDGRWAMCSIRSEGKLDLFIDSYPLAGHRVQIFTGETFRDLRFMWGRGGREILYDAGGYLVRVPLEISGDVIRAGNPTRLFEIPAAVGSMSTRDGERFLIDRRDESSPGPAMRLVQNWTGLLKK